MKSLIFLIALSISTGQTDVFNFFTSSQPVEAPADFHELETTILNNAAENDTVKIEVQSAPGFLLDKDEDGNTYEIICYDTDSDNIEPGYLFSEPERFALCQQYLDDGTDARMPVRSFMNLGGGNWMQVNHYEEDRSLSISENPEVFIRVDSVFYTDPVDFTSKVHVFQYLHMDGR